MPDTTVLTSRTAIPDASIRWFILRTLLLEKLRDNREYASIAYSLTAGINAADSEVYTESGFYEGVETIRRAAWELSDYGDDSYNLNQVNGLFLSVGIEEIDDESFDRPTTVKLVTVQATITFNVDNLDDVNGTERDVRQYIRLNLSDGIGNIDDIGNIDYSIDSIEVSSDE